MMQTVTIAIPTYKRPQYVLDALHSVLIQQTDFLYEVLILDNACDSTLQTKVESIAKATPISVRYIPISEIGLHNGRNTAAIIGKGEIIVYIDDDIIAPQGWLQELCQPFQDETVGGVAGKTLPQWEATPPDWIKTLPPSYFSLLDEGDNIKEMKQPNTPYGCNMAYRRSIILELGGFPPDGVGGGKIEWRRGDGETGFSYKVYEHNYKIIYTGQGWLYHRIPEKRMTIDAVRHRAMKDAITPFYTEMRANHYSRWKLLKKAIKNTLKFLWFKTQQIQYLNQPIHQWICYDTQATCFGIRALYQLRLIFDFRLREWLFCDSYLEGDNYEDSNLILSR